MNLPSRLVHQQAVISQTFQVVFFVIKQSFHKHTKLSSSLPSNHFINIPNSLLHYQVVILQSYPIVFFVIKKSSHKHTQLFPSVFRRNAEVHQWTDRIVSFMIRKKRQHRNTQSAQVARHRTDHFVLSNIDKRFQKERKPLYACSWKVD